MKVQLSRMLGEDLHFGYRSPFLNHLQSLITPPFERAQKCQPDRSEASRHQPGLLGYGAGSPESGGKSEPGFALPFGFAWTSSR